MELRSSRSRSRTPFSLKEEDYFEGEDNNVEMSVVRTTRRTTIQQESKDFSTNSHEEYSSISKSKPVKRSLRSEKSLRKLYKTSDYSSDDAEHEVASSRTITQNERNQFIEDARKAANGSSEISALDLYIKSGRYWEKYPKTDWTYSKHSRDRVEIAPGVVAMPNMSRRTIHSMYTDTVDHKASNTDSSLFYKSYNAKKLFNNNEEDETSYRLKTTTRVGFWRRIKQWFSRVYMAVWTVLYYAIGVQTAGFAQLHRLSSWVMLMDTWVLRKRNGAGNKVAMVVGLCLLPLLFLGGMHVLLASGIPLAPSCHPYCGRIATTYFNSFINAAFKVLNFSQIQS